MAEVIAGIVGWSVLLLAVGAVARVVIRRARALGLLAPLAVGFLLRLAVMLIAHIGSLSLGDHGLLVVDDQTYLNGGVLVSELWRGGHTSNLTQPDVLGTYQLGYQLFLAAIFTLTTPSVLLGKVMNVLFGTITILLVGILGGRLLGERARLRAAWVAALAPSLVWWSAPLLKEAGATMLMMFALIAITYLPRPRALALLAFVIALFMVVRGPAAFALVAGALLAVAIAGRKTERTWVSRPLVTYLTVMLTGFVVLVVVVSRGNVVSLYHQYEFVVNNMIDAYQGNNPVRVPYDAVKSLVTPLPWVFDARTTSNWDRSLYPGVWVLICALPLAAMGAWRLRTRPEGWALVGTAATVLCINAFTSGFVFRQRSMIEPILLLLALAGARSWQMAARCAAATLAVFAAVAGVQSRSPLVVALVLIAALAVFLLSRRLPSEPFDELPPSPMVANFESALAASPPVEGPLPVRVAAYSANTVRAAGATLAAWRTALLSRGPRFERRAQRGSQPPLSLGEALRRGLADPTAGFELETAPLGPSAPSRPAGSARARVGDLVRAATQLAPGVEVAPRSGASNGRSWSFEFPREASDGHEVGREPGVPLKTRVESIQGTITRFAPSAPLAPGPRQSHAELVLTEHAQSASVVVRERTERARGAVTRLAPSVTVAPAPSRSRAERIVAAGTRGVSVIIRGSTAAVRGAVTRLAPSIEADESTTPVPEHDRSH
jgi:hypothetical protein